MHLGWSVLCRVGIYWLPGKHGIEGNFKRQHAGVGSWGLGRTGYWKLKHIGERFSLVEVGGGRVSGNARTSEQVKANEPITSNKHYPPFSGTVVINVIRQFQHTV